jgi:hypothetical protein
MEAACRRAPGWPLAVPKALSHGGSVGARRLRVRAAATAAGAIMFDTASDGGPIGVLSKCDEFTSEVVGGLVGRSTTANDVVAELYQPPARLRRPGVYPRRQGIGVHGPDEPRLVCQYLVRGQFYGPRIARQNAFEENFNRCPQDDPFAREVCDFVLDAKGLHEDWRQPCNRYHHQRAMGFQPPEVLAKAFTNPKIPRSLDLRSGPLTLPRRGPQESLDVRSYAATPLACPARQGVGCSRRGRAPVCEWSWCHSGWPDFSSAGDYPRRHLRPTDRDPLRTGCLSWPLQPTPRRPLR